MSVERVGRERGVCWDLRVQSKGKKLGVGKERERGERELVE